MRLLEGRAVQPRGLVKGKIVYAHQDPATHPFNNYSEADNESDRKWNERGESGAPDWLYKDFRDRYGHDPDGYGSNRDNDQDDDR